MMCHECKHFRHFTEKKTHDYPGSEDWGCSEGHEILREENGMYIDFIPAKECHDYQPSYRMTAEDDADLRGLEMKEGGR